MTTTNEHLCTIAAPGVEVVTVQKDDGRFETEIHGGRLDGETFVCDQDPHTQHQAAVMMVRLVARKRFASIDT